MVLDDQPVLDEFAGDGFPDDLLYLPAEAFEGVGREESGAARAVVAELHPVVPQEVGGGFRKGGREHPFLRHRYGRLDVYLLTVGDDVDDEVCEF